MIFRFYSCARADVLFFVVSQQIEVVFFLLGEINVKKVLWVTSVLCTMLYFTYGSFMDINNLKRHTPSAEFMCKALIPNWEVQFNYYSKNYGGGVTGIEPALNKLVRGAVCEIPTDEIEHLDTVEGVPQGTYYRHPIMVVSEQGEPMLAHVYRTTNPRGPFKPTRRYLRYMVDGAKALGLPADYVAQLEAVETVD